MSLTLTEAEAIERKNRNMFWDGWNLVIVDTRRDGFTNRYGIWHNSRWSVKKVVSPNREGKYDISDRDLRTR